MRRSVGEIARLLGGVWAAPPDDKVMRIRPRGVTIDSRAVRPGDVFVALPGARVDGRDFIGAAVGAGAVVALAQRREGSPQEHTGRTMFVGDAVAALATLAADHRDGMLRTEVVGVTGSVGKTTTCRLLDAALGSALRGSASARSFNNHLGVPLTLLNADEEDDYVISEIGASGPGEIARLAGIARPTVAVITGAGRAHLEGFGSVAGVAREKGALARAVGPGGVVFVAEGFPAGDEELGSGGAEVLRVGAGAGASVRIAGVEHVRLGGRTGETPVPLGLGVARLSEPGVESENCNESRKPLTPALSRGERGGCTGETPVPLGAVPLGVGEEGTDRIGLRVTLADGGVFEAPIAGRALAMNVALAAAVGRRLGLRDADIAAGLRRMIPAPMRFERSLVGGVEIFNDAYNANPESLAVAMETFAEVARRGSRRVMVLGDMLELGAERDEQHAEALERVRSIAGVCLICLIGPAFAHAAMNSNDERIVTHADADDRAIAAAAALIEPGDSVLIKGSRGMRLERLVGALASRGLVSARTD